MCPINNCACSSCSMATRSFIFMSLSFTHLPAQISAWWSRYVVVLHRGVAQYRIPYLRSALLPLRNVSWCSQRSFFIHKMDITACTTLRHSPENNAWQFPGCASFWSMPVCIHRSWEIRIEMTLQIEDYHLCMSHREMPWHNQNQGKAPCHQ